MAFDYIIVGAGSAGCVLADRLSADGRFSVAVLEAGGSDRNFWIQMPLGYGKTFYDPTVNWMYRAEPDPGLNGQEDYWPRGKVLGGSSSINAMVYIRGNPSDYDDWAAEGNSGWSWQDLLPHFKSLEDFEGPADAFRAKGGRLHITDVSGQLHPLAQRFLKAGEQAGLPFTPDFNGASQEGVGVYQINTKGGWRHSAARAFLRPAMKRAKVTVITRAHATRILFEGKRAVGIEYQQGAQRREVRANREVILSAGSVNSPQLLQLSGIGEGGLLQSLGIPVLLDQPNVGQHLQDHHGINYLYRAKVRSLNEVLRPWWGKALVGAQFLLLGKGPLSLSLNQAGGFIRTRPGLTRPNIQLYCQAITTTTAKTGSRPLLTPDPFPGIALGLSNTRPTSRGSLQIVSPDPFAKPKIKGRAYATAEDQQDLLEGVKFLRHLARQPALAEVLVEELKPGASVVSDEALANDYRQRSGTVYHPAGTCRMAPDATKGVVDASLKVHGLEGLRIADASIFPAVITGNTNAAAMMTSAKAAALILETAR